MTRARCLITACALLAMSCMAVEPSAKESPIPARTHELVHYGDVTIEVVTEGTGAPVLLLPSTGRDSYDYDDVAGGLAANGFRVLRPQPRGIGKSKGPTDNLTLHDFARDIATVIERENAGPAVIVGHAYGHFVARMTAVDHPRLVRGVVVAAGAARTYPDTLPQLVSAAADPSRPEEERLEALRAAFFAPGNDPVVWLAGWHPEARKIQREAADRTDKDSWFLAAPSPILDLQAADDPWRPPSTTGELKDLFGDKVSIASIPRSSHALFPEQPRAVVDAITRWIRQLPG